VADARDIVTDALREIGVLAAGEVAAADDALSGLAALNRLVDQWAAERLTIYRVARTTFTITTSVGAYDVGTSQTINRLRPDYIDGVSVIDTTVTPNVELPLDPLTDDGYRGLSSKSLTSTLPTHFYYDPVYPYGSLKLWPVPTGTTLTGVLYSPLQVSEFASLSTTVSLPSGYRRMLIKNLALELAPSYGAPVSPDLRAQAGDSVAVVKRRNRPKADLSFGADALLSGGRGFDIRVG